MDTGDRTVQHRGTNRAWQSGEIQDKDSNWWLQLPSRSTSSRPPRLPSYHPFSSQINGLALHLRMRGFAAFQSGT